MDNFTFFLSSATNVKEKIGEPNPERPTDSTGPMYVPCKIMEFFVKNRNLYRKSEICHKNEFLEKNCGAKFY